MVLASPIINGLLLITYGCQVAPTSAASVTHHEQKRSAIMRKQGDQEDEENHPSLLTLASQHDVRPQLKHAKVNHAHIRQKIHDYEGCHAYSTMNSCDEHKRCRWETEQCREAHVKHGFCANWQEGSSWRILGDGRSYWGPGEQMMQQTDCWSKCHSDPACQQAVYKVNETDGNSKTYCWIGINTMDEHADVPQKSEQCQHSSCHEYCYAKDGWDPAEHERDVLTPEVVAERVKPGWCADWIQGGGQQGSPKQCLIDHVFDDSVDYPEDACSHWGPEFDLSERGCWEKCEANPTCTQAVYKDEFSKHACWIGTSMMRSVPRESSDVSDKCYAKAGYGFQVGVNTMGEPPTEAIEGAEQCSDIDGTGISSKYPCTCGTATCIDQTMCHKSHDGNGDHCKPQYCSSTTPDDISHTYPCTCAEGVTCTRETGLCEATASRCHAMSPCSDTAGGTSHTYPCECGTLACVAGTVCKIGGIDAHGNVTHDGCNEAPTQQT